MFRWRKKTCALTSQIRVAGAGIIVWLITVALLPVAPAAADSPDVIVIGIDGMDPKMLQQFADKGLMPRFSSLMERGSFTPLGTSVPPQSPVAWSNFITGMDPGGHGVFDFIHRDPQTYLPLFSTALVTEPERVLSIGEWIIPLSAGKSELLRKGKAFWQYFDDEDVPYTIFRIPANFPPAQAGDQTISGMGTPDIQGSYGTFSFFTDDELYKEIDVSGGDVYLVDPSNDIVEGSLRGPENSLKKSRPVLERPFTVYIDRQADAAKFEVGDESFLLQVGEWSDWIRVKFDLVGPLKGVTGIARFHLKAIEPYFELYVTPINIDPSSPALPISTPAGFAKTMYERIGYFYTQGMPEDTKALEHGMLNDGEFVDQTRIVMRERWAMLDAVMSDYKDGFLFFYVSTVDQSCHALWRNMDEKHPAHAPDMSFGDRIEHLYVEMDSLLGYVMDRMPEDATLIVMSDHGFAPYYKKFHLNTWLYENGYLTLIRPDEIGQHPFLTNVFWRRSKAYAIGINGLYINKLGRETKGIVRDGQQFEELIDELEQKLLAVRDPETGEQVITTVYRTSEIYHGSEAVNAPDIIVGYNVGYRGSDESALGTVHPTVITPNLGKWTGTHCMDHAHVPGILLSNRPLGDVADPDLKDLTTTILSLYGIPQPEQMRGRVVLGEGPVATGAQR